MTSRKLNNSKDIENAIKELETSVKAREVILKGQVEHIKTQLKPSVLLKDTFIYAKETPGLKRIVINSAIGLVAGFLLYKSKQLLSRDSLNKGAQKIIRHQIVRIEQQKPESAFSKLLGYVRKFTPPDSALHPFVRL